jgi:hypothetical protein
VADATLQILGLGTSAVPLDYNVSGPQTLDLIAVKGDFDGTASGVDFVPVVEIISPAGAVMATSTGPTITAGSSATVTFAPFLRGATSTTPPASGIQFDTDNEGGYLYVATDARSPVSPPPLAGLVLLDRSGWGVIVESDNFGNLALISGGDLHAFADAGQIIVQCLSAINLIAGAEIALSAGNFASVSAKNGITLDPDNAASGTEHLTVLNLPTVNPGGAGIVWNDAGTLKIT